MSNVKKAVASTPKHLPLEELTPAEQLQIKGGTDDTSQEDLVVEDIVNM